MPTHDAELLEQWRGGDTTAGGALVRRHFAALSRFFRGKVLEPADLIQQTLLAAVESRDRVPEGAVRVYFLGIARRVLAQHMRRTFRESLAEISLSRLPETAPSLPSALAAREQTRLLLHALRELPLQLQLALELHYWERLSMEDIGRVLDVPAGTVKSRLSRARRLLRTAIERHAVDHELARSTLGELDRWAQALRRELSQMPER